MQYTIWVAADCNLKCRYCYEGPNKPILIMNKETANDVVEYIKNDFIKTDMSELKIVFHGGEPLLNFDVMKYFVKEIKNLFPNVYTFFSLTTNGTIFNEEILHFLSNDIDEVTVSIDGTKSTHDFMRPYKNGKGSYDTVISNAKETLKKVKSYRIRMTFDSDTVGSLAEDVIHLIEMGFNCIVPAPNLFDNRWDNIHLELLERQILIIKDFIKNNKGVLVGLCDPIDYISKASCNGGKSSKVIYTDGTIYPCIMSGGVSGFEIGDIWNGIDEAKLDKLLSYSNIKNPECEGCGMSPACNASRCKIINKLITGDFNSPPVMECEMMNLLYRINGICHNI